MTRPDDPPKGGSSIGITGPGSPGSSAQSTAFGWRWLNWLLLAGTLVAIAFLARILLAFRSRRPESQELDFWTNLLSPLSGALGVNPMMPVLLATLVLLALRLSPTSAEAEAEVA